MTNIILADMNKIIAERINIKQQVVLVLVATITVLAGMPHFVHAAMAGVEPSIFSSNLNRGLAGWWTFDGNDMISNAYDRSRSGHSGSLNSFPATSTAIRLGKMGQALIFDGADDEIDTGSEFINTQPMTVSAWMNPTSLGELSLGTIIFNAAISFRVEASNKLTFSSDNTTFASSATSAYNFNQWTFVSATRDASGTANLYVNGVLSGTANQSSGTVSAGQTNVLIGNNNSRTVTFNGLLDDVRVYNRVLSAREILQLYNASFAKQSLTPSTFPNPLRSGLTGWWTMDGADTNLAAGTEADKRGGGSTGTLNSFSTSTAVVTGKIGQALAFNGVSNINIPALSTFMSSATGTISAWFYANGGNAGNCTIGTASGIVADSSGFFWLSYDGANLCAGEFDGADRNVSVSAPAGQWTHAVLVHRNGVINLWKNGTLAGAVAAGNINDITGQVYIGNGASLGFRGYVDDVHMYSSALSTSTIQLLYNQGASKINLSTTPPNSSLASGLVGWWTFDGKKMFSLVTDSSGTGNDGDMFNFAATTSVMVPGKLGQALSFDGVNDYIRVGNSTTWHSDDGTISAWVRSTNDNDEELMGFSSGSAHYTVELGNNSTGICTNELVMVFITSTGVIMCYTTATRTELFDDKWHFIAITEDTATHIYIDGVSKTVTIGTGADTGLFTTSASNYDNLWIGTLDISASKFNQYKGTMDDVRLYNRALSPAEVVRLYSMGR